jgi:hypothetical protein
MRNKATCLLGLIYMIVLLRPWLPSMMFSLNAHYIQTELCVQKDKQENTCKGACFMKKSLQAQQEHGQDLPGLNYEEIELAQLQPACDLNPERMPPAHDRLWAWCSDEQGNDQFVSDLPVPPPWIINRLS